MPDLFDDVRSFHAKFNLSYDGPPRTLPSDEFKFRAMFLDEEWGERNQARQDGSLVDEFDAIIDQVYILLGDAVRMGLDFNEGWRRVHEANMKKVRAARPEDSKRGSGFDVVKPEGWEHPSLYDLAYPGIF